uniref:WGS project CBMG000000000 data, contig CS5907-c001999 n=1 Tax=Fusarium acuminatum CS5907 TaxID=1318461 RepID=A0A090N512_9HYPO|nr:unnamed protein product [Fusarium acuminatum CS5907]
MTVSGSLFQMNLATDLVHVRLWLDEVPEPLVRKCKPLYESISMVPTKVSEELSCVMLDVRRAMNDILNVNIDMAMVVGGSAETDELYMEMSNTSTYRGLYKGTNSRNRAVPTSTSRA